MKNKKKIKDIVITTTIKRFLSGAMPMQLSISKENYILEEDEEFWNFREMK